MLACLCFARVGWVPSVSPGEIPLALTNSKLSDNASRFKRHEVLQRKGFGYAARI